MHDSLQTGFKHMTICLYCVWDVGVLMFRPAAGNPHHLSCCWCGYWRLQSSVNLRQCYPCRLCGTAHSVPGGRLPDVRCANCHCHLPLDPGRPRAFGRPGTSWEWHASLICESCLLPAGPVSSLPPVCCLVPANTLKAEGDFQTASKV